MYIPPLIRHCGHTIVCGSLLALLLLGSFGQVEAQFGEKIQYFPHYAVGGGATTLLTVHNPGSFFNPVTVNIELFSSNGSSVATEVLTLGGGATGTVVFGNESDPLTTGWAKLSSPGNFAASELFKIPALTNVGVLPSEPVTELKLFAFISSETNTGFAVANPSETKQSILTIQTFNTQGTLQGQST